MNVAPLSAESWEPGAQRIYINARDGGCAVPAAVPEGVTITDFVMADRVESCVGPDDVET